MINTKQKLMSSMNTLFWFGPKISTYYDSLSEPQFRSLLGGFSALSLSAAINPFSYRETVAKLNNQYSYSNSIENTTNTTQSKTSDVTLSYIFENINHKQFIDEIFHVNRELSNTDIHTYDLTNLEDSFRDLVYTNKFKYIKAIVIVNKGNGVLPVSFASTNGFGDFLGNPQNGFNIEVGGIFARNSVCTLWEVTDTNKIIMVGDGSSVNTSYELVIFGRGDFE